MCLMMRLLEAGAGAHSLCDLLLCTYTSNIIAFVYWSTSLVSS